MRKKTDLKTVVAFLMASLVFSTIAVLGLLIVGCGEDNPIALCDKSRCVNFDMDAKQVKATLGDPEEKCFDDSSGKLEYHYPGMVITFVNHSGSAIEEIYLESGYTGKTAKGIGIGSKRYEVRAAYGKPEESGYLFGDAPLPFDIYSRIGMALVYYDVMARCTSTFDYDPFGRPMERKSCTDVDNGEWIGARKTTLAYNILQDIIPPVITIISPLDGACIIERRPTIVVGYTDNLSGVDTKSVKLTLTNPDGTKDITGESTVAMNQIRYTPSADLPIGVNTLTLTVADKDGNATTLLWRFGIVVEEGVLAIWIFKSGFH